MEMELLEKAKKLLEESDAVLIYFGAGMSAASGAPVFRGDGGFWKEYPPYKELGLNFYDLANPETFYSDLSLALGFYGHRLNMYKSLKPHSGYDLIKKLIDKKKYGGFVMTSNVDSLASVAGIKNVFECHGNIYKWQCSTLKCSKNTGYYDAPEIKVDPESMRARLSNDHFCHCGNPKRPSILMFGDFAYMSKYFDEQSTSFQRFYYDLLSRKEKLKVSVLEIGAGDAISTIRVAAHRAACDFETTVIRINIDNNKELHCNAPIHLTGDAQDILRKLISE